jgi:hypothetical protein
MMTLDDDMTLVAYMMLDNLEAEAAFQRAALPPEAWNGDALPPEGWEDWNGEIPAGGGQEG